jgi:uncharacterized oligopeptide transporter (OPT) family protein
MAWLAIVAGIGACFEVLRMTWRDYPGSHPILIVVGLAVLIYYASDALETLIALRRQRRSGSN